MNDDLSLVSASLRGDVDAFGQLIERYHNLVCAIAYSRTGDRAASEDVAQETFLAAWRRIGELREPEKLRGWLCSIARNLASKSVRGRRPSDDIAEHEGQIVGDAGPLDVLLTKEMETTVWAALEQLPETYREPLVLFYREDQSIKEVAIGLGLTEETAKQRLSRGRDQLRDSVGSLIERTLAAGRPRKAATAAVLAAIVALGSKESLAATTASKAGAQTSRWKLVAGAVAVCGAIALVALGVSRRSSDPAPAASPPIDPTATLTRLRQAHDATVAPGPASTCEIDGTISDETGSRASALVAVIENTWEAMSIEPQFAEVKAGAWQLRVRAGVYTVSASAPGRHAQVQVVTCAPTAKETVALMLPRGGATLRGSISDVGGGPVATATIWVMDPQRPGEPYVTRSNADGTYALTIDPGLYTALVVHPDYTVEARPITLGTSGVREDITMLPGGSIEGSFVDAAGAPIAGGRVSTIAPAMNQRGDQPSRWQMATAYAAMLPTVTDADGKFVLRGLPPGKLRVIARSSALSTASPVDVELALAENKAGVVLTGARARSIAGFVVGSPDRALANVQVFALREGELSATPVVATTDRGGYFELAGLVPGAYRLAAVAKGFAPHVPEQTIDVSSADRRDELVVLEPGVTIRGRVDAAGARAHVKLTPAAKSLTPTSMLRAMMTRAEVDEGGAFTIAGVVPGEYVVTATSYDRRGEVEVDVGTTAPAPVRIGTEERPAIGGEVRDDHGAKLAGVLVQATPRYNRDPFAAMFTTVRTDERGAFRIVGLSPGAYDLRVYDVRGQRAWADDPKRPFRARRITVPATDPAAMSLVVASGGAKLGGSVTANGRPIADAWIEVRAREAREVPEAFPSPPVLGDANGQFQIDGFFGDELVVDVASPDGKLRATAIAKPNTSIALELQPVATLEGTVTVDGKPVSAFDVRLRHVAHSRTAKATAGRFSIDAVAGDYELVITSAAGYATRAVSMPAAKAIDVALTRWGSLRGRVVGADGKPWANANVILRESIEPAAGRTDSAGNFALDRLVAGKHALSIVGDGDAVELTEFHFELAPGQRLDAGTIDASTWYTTTASASADLGLQFFVSATPPAAAQLAAVKKDPREASRAGGDPNAGLWIVDVKPNSPGAGAGFRSGDRIVGVGMAKVSGGKSSVAMMMSLSTPWRSKGRAVPWTIVRDGREMRVDVVVP